MCELFFDEPCSVWTEKTVVARKVHRCDCCGGAIVKGEAYLRHFSVFDGYLTSEKSCLPCAEMTKRFAKAHSGQAGTPGSMRPLLDDCVTAEEDEGNAAMAEQWRGELQQMDERRTKAGRFVRGMP